LICIFIVDFDKFFHTYPPVRSSTYRGSRTNIRLLNPQSTTHSLIRKHIHSSLQHISQINRTNNTYLCSSSVFMPATGVLSRPVHCSAQLCSSHVRRPNTPFVHLLVICIVVRDQYYGKTCLKFSANNTINDTKISAKFMSFCQLSSQLHLNP
jgi:hypothetical protein